MAFNQHKSFTAGNQDHRNRAYTSSSGVSHATSDISLPGAAIIWLLRKTTLLLEKLMVLAKYQFYKRTAVAPSTIRLPWVKMAVIGLLAFMAFKDDVSFSIGMGDRGTARFGNTPVAEEASYKENGNGERAGLLGAFVEKKKDYFEDAPSDDERDRKIKAYIRRFKDIAIAEKQRFGIPASIKMAQAIVESNSGKSRLATDNNNHFGIKCFSRTCNKGHCSNFGDDSHKDFFRKYGSAWESWRAHSKMLVSGRYRPLLKHGDDYKKWAHGLKKLGYATAEHYENTLVKMIEKYHLQILDEEN